MADGWIKLHRCIKKNYLWPEKQSREFTHFEAWIDLLLKANHKPGFATIELQKVPVDRGQLLTSEVKLAERWKWSRNKVRRFLDKLENQEKSVTKNSTTKYTVITIVNYDIYQGEETANDTTVETPLDTTSEHQKDSRRNTNKNVKNDKNEKNGKKINSTKSKIQFAESVTLTEEEHAKLTERFGEDDTNTLIDILNNYKLSSGKKYKSDYHTIIGWVKDKLAQEKQRAPRVDKPSGKPVPRAFASLQEWANEGE